MKLVAFKVKNFRSIIDSGWRDLSPDNITGFIGQNESGKTSVLEALNSFYDEKLNPDFLRSDNSSPEINCSFEVSQTEIDSIYEDVVLPQGLKKALKATNNRINLKCRWSSGKYYVELEQPQLIEAFAEEITPPAPATPATAEVIEEAPAQDAETTEKPSEEPVQKPIKAVEFVKTFEKAMPKFVYFEDFQSLIPNQMDISELSKDKSKAEGLYGVRNFLTVIGINPEDLEGADNRIIQSKIDRANKAVTANFREFWSQHIGLNNKIEIEMELKYHNATDEPAKAGTPYLAFWVKDGEERLYPKQRSKGVRWFLSFYLQLKASQLSANKGQVLLIDEPGASLHARAQEDVLKVFESIKDTLQILYTTHSPYLIKPETLFRLLAVQRDDASDEKSATKILDINNIAQASNDTMFPIYTIIGADLSHQQVVKAKNNVLLEEPSAFYYINAFKKLAGETHDMHLMPATGVTKLPTLINLFMGWGLKFGVVVDDETSGRGVYNDFKKNWYGSDDTEVRRHAYKIADCPGIEDVFSKTDFKKHILADTTAEVNNGNSDYLKHTGSGTSKVVLAYKFWQNVEDGSIKMEDLNKTSQDKIKEVIAAIVALL